MIAAAADPANHDVAVWLVATLITAVGTAVGVIRQERNRR